MILKYFKNPKGSKKIELFKQSMDTFITEMSFDESEAREIFEGFINSLPKIINNIEDLLEKNDFINLSMVAHDLKGSSGNLRVSLLFELAKSLETNSNQKDKDKCIKDINKIKELFIK